MVENSVAVFEIPHSNCHYGLLYQEEPILYELSSNAALIDSCNHIDVLVVRQI